MKIQFNSLATLKKEAKRMQKYLNSEHCLHINLVQSQDIVAQAYGWESYNAASRAHAGGRIISGALPIRQLTQSQRERLELQKRQALLDHLSMVPLDVTNIILDESPLTRKRGWKSLLQILPSKDAIPDQVYENLHKGAVLTRIDDVLGSFVHKVLAKQLVSAGGFMILREQAAMHALPFLFIDLIRADGNGERLKVIRASNQAELKDNNATLDFFATGGLLEMTSWLTGSIQSLASRTYREDIIGGKGDKSLRGLISGLLGLVEAAYDGEPPTIQHLESAIHIGPPGEPLAIEAMCAQPNIPKQCVEPLLRSLGASMASGRFTMSQDDRDRMIILLRMIDEVLETVQAVSTRDKDLPSLNLKESLLSRDIVILVVDDLFMGSRGFVDTALQLYRSVMSSLLGDVLAGDESTPRKIQPGHVLLIDGWSHCHSPGIESFMAQINFSLGVSLYPAVSDLVYLGNPERQALMSRIGTYLGYKAEDFPLAVLPKQHESLEKIAQLGVVGGHSDPWVATSCLKGGESEMIFSRLPLSLDL